MKAGFRLALASMVGVGMIFHDTLAKIGLWAALLILLIGIMADDTSTKRIYDINNSLFYRDETNPYFPILVRKFG